MDRSEKSNLTITHHDDVRPALKIEFRTKNQIIYGMLRDAVVRGDFKPGEHLVIDVLAEQMAVSHIPIREALRQLESDGFLTFEPHIGFTVTPIHADLIVEVFALLEAAEVVSSRRACEVMTAEQFDAVGAMLRAMDQVVSDPNRWTEENKRLHLFICDCAKTSLVTITMKNALDHWDRLQKHFFSNVLTRRMSVAQQDHWRILEAMRKGDPDAVERAVREHNQAALHAYLEFLDQGGGK